MDYIKEPQRIESTSFQILDDLIKRERPEYQFGGELEEKIIKRAIHTTVDLDYLDILTFESDPLPAIEGALGAGACIYTDTTMVMAGINKGRLEALGSSIRCLIADESVADMAQEKGITRSMAAVDVAARDPREKVFVVGNAPTALRRIVELNEAGLLENTAAVIGVPVGFVGSAEAKEELAKSGLPCIISRGMKGGSNVAAAIVNAILYHLAG